MVPVEKLRSGANPAGNCCGCVAWMKPSSKAVIDGTARSAIVNQQRTRFAGMKSSKGESVVISESLFASDGFCRDFPELWIRVRVPTEFECSWWKVIRRRLLGSCKRMTFMSGHHHQVPVLSFQIGVSFHGGCGVNDVAIEFRRGASAQNRERCCLLRIVFSTSDSSAIPCRRWEWESGGVAVCRKLFGGARDTRQDVTFH